MAICTRMLKAAFLSVICPDIFMNPCFVLFFSSHIKTHFCRLFQGLGGVDKRKQLNNSEITVCSCLGPLQLLTAVKRKPVHLITAIHTVWMSNVICYSPLSSLGSLPGSSLFRPCFSPYRLLTPQANLCSKVPITHHLLHPCYILLL